jgi:hemerythrin-like metal-binding protein
MNDLKRNNSNQSNWNDSYLLDIPEIDKQHQYFFQIFDRLNALNNNAQDYQKIEAVIDELEAYTHEHFNTEELLMKSASSPGIDLHLQQHRVFEKKIGDFKTAYRYKNNVLLDEILTFLRKWFLMHITEVDKSYSASLKQYLSTKED